MNAYSFEKCQNYNIIATRFKCFLSHAVISAFTYLPFARQSLFNDSYFRYYTIRVTPSLILFGHILGIGSAFTISFFSFAQEEIAERYTYTHSRKREKIIITHEKEWNINVIVFALVLPELSSTIVCRNT